jgi:hypothetical protein
VFNIGDNIYNSASTFFKTLLTKLNNISVNIVCSRNRLYFKCHRIDRGGVSGCKTDIIPHLMHLISVNSIRNIYILLFSEILHIRLAEISYELLQFSGYMDVFFHSCAVAYGKSNMVSRDSLVSQMVHLQSALLKDNSYMADNCYVTTTCTPAVESAL